MPVEAKTINYLRASNHEVQADLVQAYTQANGLYCTGNETPEYTDVLELDLGTVMWRLCFQTIATSRRGSTRK